MDVMKGILVRINANGKDCISTSMESLAAKILALALAQRMAHARRTGSGRVAPVRDASHRFRPGRAGSGRVAPVAAGSGRASAIVSAACH